MNLTAHVYAFPSGARIRPPLPRVWLLLSNRLGDNNQLFALAEALGFRFEAKVLTFNWLRKTPLARGSGLAIVSPDSRRLIRPPWPDLVISAGYPAVPVARRIRGESAGAAKLIHIGNARADISDFDLHITTPQYPGRATERLIELPFPIGNPAEAVQPTREERDWLNAYPRPLRLIAVGGPARHWKLDHGALREAICRLRDKQPQGSIIVATSPRTRTGTRNLLKQEIRGSNEVLVERFPAFAALLSEADEIHVTADSVSMISEAILTGKPVGLIPIRRSVRGQLAHWLSEPFGRTTVPDFSRFWGLLKRERLIGTVELPVANQVCDTVQRAATAVRSLLAPGDVVDDGKQEEPRPGMGIAWRSRGRQ